MYDHQLTSLGQINYLIDEAVNCGKGANSVISMLHHFLSTHNLGEATLHLHADNCSGQNKNRYVMQYLAWQILTGLNKKITLSFLVVGHTKFSPDWCFGLFKQAFRRSKVGCLDDIVRVVEKSATVNHAQLVGTQDGEVIVPTYDWAQFFDHPFRQKALKGIKAMHHLTFTNTHKGSVFVQDINSPEREIRLGQDDEWRPTVHNLPPVIPPPGLSLQCRQYLFEKIREFCPPDCQDLVCPDPSLDPPTRKRARQQ